MDHEKVLKEVDDILELSDIQADEKNQIASEKNDEKRDTEMSEYSNIDSIGSSESFSKYVYDRAAPSFYMILAEQEMSRQTSLEESQEEVPITTVDTIQNAIAQAHLQAKLKGKEDTGEAAQDEENEEENEQAPVAPSSEEEQPPVAPLKVTRRETVRFLSQDEILGQKKADEGETESHEVAATEDEKSAVVDDEQEPQSPSDHMNVAAESEVHMDETDEATTIVQTTDQQIEPQLEMSRDDDVEAESERERSLISFQHKAYDETTTFKMQPEIIGAIPESRDEMPGAKNEKFVFGSPTAPARKLEEVEYCECESTVPRSRSYGVLANVVLKTVSQYSIKRHLPLDEIRKQISLAEMKREISSEEVSLLEAAVDRIEKCEELRAIDPHNDTGLQVLMEYIGKLFDVLKVILFGEHKAATVSRGSQVQEEQIGEREPAPNESSIEQLATKVIKEEEEEEVESVADKLRRILLGSHMQIRKEYESKLCACSNDEPTHLQQKSEVDIELANGILRTVRRSTKAAISQDSVVNQASKVASPSVEEVSNAAKSQTLVINDKAHLRKYKNEEDLSAIGVKASPSFVLRSSDIEENAVSRFVKYPKLKTNISVLSVPSVHHGPSDALQASLMTNYLNKKGEDISNAVINDFNDDGYVNLPKVPSTTLSSVSSTAWIDDNNASFFAEERAPTKTTTERISFSSSPPTVINPPTVAEQQQAASSSATPSVPTAAKPKGKFRKCMCFLQQLTKPFVRKSTKKDKK